jgi:hypothetical protein
MVEPEAAGPGPTELKLLAGAAERLAPDEREWMAAEMEHVTLRSTALAGEGAWSPDE